MENAIVHCHLHGVPHTHIKILRTHKKQSSIESIGIDAMAKWNAQVQPCVVWMTSTLPTSRRQGVEEIVGLGSPDLHDDAPPAIINLYIYIM